VFGEGERTYTTNVNDIEANRIILAPNPVSSVVSIEAGIKYDTVSIYDVSGKMLIQAEINQELSLDVSALPAGLYMVKLEGDAQPQITKLIKQ